MIIPVFLGADNIGIQFTAVLSIFKLRISNIVFFAIKYNNQSSLYYYVPSHNGTLQFNSCMSLLINEKHQGPPDCLSGFLKKWVHETMLTILSLNHIP